VIQHGGIISSIFDSAGVEVKYYPYYDPATNGLRFDDMMAILEAEAQAGDVLLLHACCHNQQALTYSLTIGKSFTDFRE